MIIKTLLTRKNMQGRHVLQSLSWQNKKKVVVPRSLGVCFIAYWVAAFVSRRWSGRGWPGGSKDYNFLFDLILSVTMWGTHRQAMWCHFKAERFSKAFGTRAEQTPNMNISRLSEPSPCLHGCDWFLWARKVLQITWGNMAWSTVNNCIRV
jgi:hypothetical protein